MFKILTKTLDREPLVKWGPWAAVLKALALIWRCGRGQDPTLPTPPESPCFSKLRHHTVLCNVKVLFITLQGSHSSTDEQGTAALKTIELDNRLGGAAVQVRVVQGKEPTHFLAMFQGQMVVYQGGLASAFDGKTGIFRVELFLN